MKVAEALLIACIIGFSFWKTMAVAHGSKDLLSSDPARSGTKLDVGDAVQHKQEPATMKETEEAFRQLAPKLPWFNVNNVVYDSIRKFQWKPTGERIVYREIFSQRHVTANLLKLLSDPDPKVRTLAIAALYAKEDPSLLPHIAALLKDKAETYPAPELLDMPPEAGPPLREQTVGQVAGSFIVEYMLLAGWRDRHPKEPTFAQYWEEYKHRKYCASWLRVKFERATQGTRPIDNSRRAKIADFRKQLNKIPAPDRDWIFLYLASDEAGDAFAPETDILKSMKELGPQNLLKMLQDKIPSDDPDLQPRPLNNWDYERMKRFVLQRAKDVLLPNQADALLACEREQQRGLDLKPLWAAAAARLNPLRARIILHDKFAQLDNGQLKDYTTTETPILAAALWTAGGLKEESFLLDRFYMRGTRFDDKKQSHYRQLWLEKIAEETTSNNHGELRRMMKDLVNDPRFAALNDPSALYALTQVTSQLGGKLTVPMAWELRQKASHPLGSDRACWDLEASERKYPKETKQMLIGLAEWREHLSASVKAGL